MKIIVLIILCVIGYAVFETVRVRALVTTSAQLVAQAMRYERETEGPRILVIGDSTAAGVGAASPEESVPGRVGSFLEASVENHAVSGAVVSEIMAQFKDAKEEAYDLILIQGGANDIIQLLPLETTVMQMEALLSHARTKSDRVVLLTAGKVGDAPLFPRIAAPYFTHRAAWLREEFIRISEERGVNYVDLFSAADVFKTDTSRYYAPDFFHPSGNGYEVWFIEAQKIIEEEWPEIVHAK